MGTNVVITPVVIVTAVIADWLLGEPQHYHPLSGFGLLANKIEQIFQFQTKSNKVRCIQGMAAVMLLIAPLISLAYWLEHKTILGPIISVILLYFCLGHKSLYQHALSVWQALQQDNEPLARYYAGRLVSRDTETLNIPSATAESVLENGNDAVFATLFWFMIAGAAGAVGYRLINTLDAMWGYRNTRYLYFGRFAARLDDVVNWLPARFTALTYALLGATHQALQCWQSQAKDWDSPNAGPVMASGAGALQIELGGPARYHGKWHPRTKLGCGQAARADDIPRCLSLVSKGVIAWLLIYTLIYGAIHA